MFQRRAIVRNVSVIVGWNRYTLPVLVIPEQANKITVKTNENSRLLSFNYATNRKKYFFFKQYLQCKYIVTITLFDTCMYTWKQRV